MSNKEYREELHKQAGSMLDFAHSARGIGLKKSLSTKCIGYQCDEKTGLVISSVQEDVLLFEDGHQQTMWNVYPLGKSIMTDSGYYQGVAQAPSGYTTDRPRIDKEFVR